MIFLAYRYVGYIKPQYYLSLQPYYYDMICGKQKNKKKNIMHKEIKFQFAWRSWIFDLMSEGQDATIVKFTYELFPSTRYIRTYRMTPPPDPEDFCSYPVEICSIKR